MDRSAAKQRRLSAPTAASKDGEKGRKRSISSASTSRSWRTSYTVAPKKGKQTALVESPPEARTAWSPSSPPDMPLDDFDELYSNASTYRPPGSPHPKLHCEHNPPKAVVGISRAATGARSPSPISLGSPIFRPGSPVFNPPKVFSPYQMKFPQTFQTAMEDHHVFDEADSGQASSMEPSDYIDWNSECSSTGPARTSEALYFDATDIGSYPPRAADMLLFPPITKRKRQLEELDIDEDLLLQPETDVQPLEGHEEEGRAIDKPSKKGRPTKLTLPLDLFDNPDMDLVHPSISIKEAQERGERGVPARTRFYSNDGKATWRACEVLSYDKKIDGYTIGWLSLNGQPTGKTKMVKRLNLLLDRESQGNFIARLIAAKELRKRVEAQMRYSTFLESIPSVNPAGVDDNLLLRLMKRFGRNLSLKFSDVVKAFMEELKVDYQKSVNKAILDFRYEVAEGEERDHFFGLQIFPGPENITPTPRQGCLPLRYGPDAPYICLRESIAANLVLAEEAFLLVLQQFYRNMNISATLLVNPEIHRLPRPLGVDDFRLMQDEYTRDTADNFRAVWANRVLGLIDEVVPAGVELLEGPKQKLLALVSCLSLMMSEQLQHVVLQSLEVYKHIWLAYFVPRLSKDGDNQPLPIGIRRAPLFRIKLVLEVDHFEFHPKLEFVESMVQALLEGIVESVKGMDDLQTRMTDIFRHYKPKEMTTVSVDSEKVTGTWEIIQVTRCAKHTSCRRT